MGDTPDVSMLKTLLSEARAELAALREENAGLYKKLLDVDESESAELAQARALLARVLKDWDDWAESIPVETIGTVRAFLDPPRDEAPRTCQKCGVEFALDGTCLCPARDGAPRCTCLPSGHGGRHAPDCNARAEARSPAMKQDDPRGAHTCDDLECCYPQAGIVQGKCADPECDCQRDAVPGAGRCETCDGDVFASHFVKYPRHRRAAPPEPVPVCACDSPIDGLHDAGCGLGPARDEAPRTMGHYVHVGKEPAPEPACGRWPCVGEPYCDESAHPRSQYYHGPARDEARGAPEVHDYSYVPRMIQPLPAHNIATGQRVRDECDCPLKGHWDDEHTAECSSRRRAAPPDVAGGAG